MHSCASLLRISEVTKLLSFVSALNSRKHTKPNNDKISSVTYPESLYVRSAFFICIYIKRNLSGRSLQNFGLSGYTESKIYAVWFQKWPTDGPSYANTTKMFSIKKAMLPEDKF